MTQASVPPALKIPRPYFFERLYQFTRVMLGHPPTRAYCFTNANA